MQLEHLTGKKILITGATGFVGSHLLDLLTTTQAQISCLVRASSNRSCLPDNIQVHEANLQTGQGLSEALVDKDIIIHLASLLFGLGWQDYLEANSLAAENLGSAIAKQNCIKRVVYVSSLAASGPCAISPGISDVELAKPVSAYGWSKLMSEQILHKYCQQKLVTLRPPIIYGSKDKGLLPYFKAAQQGLIITPGFNRKFPVSAIHAKDMAMAIACALQPHANGIYHCNDGAEHTMQSIGLSIAKALGRNAKCYGIPLAIMGPTASLMSLGARILHCGAKHITPLKSLALRPPAWNRDKFREAREAGWLCDGTRIANELDFKPSITLEQGLLEAIEGYKAAGWLK